MKLSLATYRRIASLAAVLAFGIVVLGAWVRLTDAGLGCPDWPGCYGEATVPESPEAITRANTAYPERPVEAGKAWREMIHRYFAGALLLLVAFLAASAIHNRHVPGQPVKLPVTIFALVVFQALLGMWTVTLLLKPVVVMAHLLGGMTTLALLFWLSLAPPDASIPQDRNLGYLAVLALVVVGLQISLGGWTSSNYSALACPDFPTCQNRWWPDMDFGEAFVIWRGLGVDYTGGVLEHPARVAIHMTHRIGAVLTTLALAAVIFVIFAGSSARRLRTAAARLGAVLAAQLTLGITTVQLGLPLSLATAHNAFAALLLLSVVYLNRIVWTHGTMAPGTP